MPLTIGLRISSLYILVTSKAPITSSHITSLFFNIFHIIVPSVSVFKLRHCPVKYFILVCVLILIFYLTNDDEEFVGVVSLLVLWQVHQHLPRSPSSREKSFLIFYVVCNCVVIVAVTAKN